MCAIPATGRRVPRHTAEDVNRRIERAMRARVDHHAAHPEMIDARLAELDREWDIERTLEANAATVALVVKAGPLVSKRPVSEPATRSPS